MTDAIERFRSAYGRAFVAHLRDGDETGLREAYELGRAAMHEQITGLRDAYELGRAAIHEQISVLDLAAIHHDVMCDTLEATHGSQSLRTVADAASKFFLEVLSTHEMVQRGVTEAHENARLKQHHAEQLQRLAEASVSIHAAGSLPEMMEQLLTHTVRVLEAASATVTLGLDTAQPVSRSFPPSDSKPGRDVARLARLLRRNGSDLGLLEVYAPAGRSFTADDEAMLTQLAQLAGVALENAELHNQERVVAETLQRRLLPGGLPAFPGVTMAARYLPGWEGSDVGGDWYDALALAPDRLALVVGDVVGKGIRAAAGMGQIRIVLRAYAIEGHAPKTVIERLGTLLEELEEDFTTVVYLVYQASTGTLRYANAGHPPPVLITPDGSAVLLRGALGPPLGAVFGAGRDEAETIVPQGSTLVVYTDGLIERRGRDIDRGLGRLLEVAGATDASDLDAFSDQMLAEMDVDNREDDIALLVARFEREPG